MTPTMRQALAAIDELAFQMGGSPLDGKHHPHVGAIQDWTQRIRLEVDPESEQSGRSCGCDPGLRKNGVVIGYICEQHR